MTSVPAFPAASRAVSVRTLFPGASEIPATAQLVVPVAAPEAPVAAFVHVTSVTATLSEAVPPSAAVDEEVEEAGEEVGLVIVHTGAVTSGRAYVTVIVSAPVFPTASRATTTIALSPSWSVTEATLHAVVPDAVPFAPVARFVHTTTVTPTLSDAVPPRATVETVVEEVGEEVGAVIEQTGAEGS
jgi:hypothetical protein